jgi:hypothetical protein
LFGTARACPWWWRRSVSRPVTGSNDTSGSTGRRRPPGPRPNQETAKKKIEALIRHFKAAVSVAAQRQAAAETNSPATAATTAAAIAADRKRGVLERFGIPTLNGDWRSEPVLKARATGWVGGNSFALDNGQVWEGTETIPFEIAGREIEIQPRPAGAFALSIEGKNTTVRVRRIK